MKNSNRKFFTALSFILSIIIVSVIAVSCGGQEVQKPKFGLVIHGGAGKIEKASMPPEVEAEYTAKLNEVLQAGYKVLADGGSSLDAVEKAINLMEDSPLFNAGKGAVFTNNGVNELDASIMEGKTLNAGAVAGVKHIKNPISLARLVMEKSPHVMLACDGAEIFARENGVELVEQEYFYTDSRWKSLQRELEKEKGNQQSSIGSDLEVDRLGTVGCVAIDKDGNLAAGTSTGGMTNKKFGRIGDSPVIGAGTYAKNETCAVSGTGHGEFFIRLGIAKDVSDLMEYKGLFLQDAANEVIYKKLKDLDGVGGIIALDKNGNIAMPFNTSGMFRGYYLENGEPVVKMYKD